MQTLTYQKDLLDRLERKFINIDWQWEGDDEYDERRLYPTLDFDEENRNSKVTFLKRMIAAEGYGE